ncbi:MAG: YggS family pyridoxal phosphate-dependent enzyme [Gammaproteobacteria bacterium]|nr:YggS family pyridoxal phosphate-dependent enzyme [Gammaproteobacteria bacterium]MDH5650414.1 YggS family pyridoxal phosphate-dependent enzyme [Gammaproteobacteria bacterium]
MKTLTERINAIRARISELEQQYGRDPGSVMLLAVSKTRPVAEIRAAMQTGQRDFGENYLQDALPKIAALSDQGLCWHFIGPIQSNKTRDIAAHFDWVHSVDRLKVAQRLNDHRPAGTPPLNICLQVNISHDPNKSGVMPADALALAKQLVEFPALRLRGLMTIPVHTETLAEQRAIFRALHELAETIRQAGIAMDTLSMGMTEDMEAAIAEGATMVRIGTAIFGSRSAHNE